MARAEARYYIFKKEFSSGIFDTRGEIAAKESFLPFWRGRGLKE